MNQKESELQRLCDRLTRFRELLTQALPHVRDKHLARMIEEALQPPPELSGETLDEIARVNREMPGEAGTRQILRLLGRG